MEKMITDIFVLSVLLALTGFAFFMWREWAHFFRKNQAPLPRMAAGFACFILTAPLLLLGLAAVLSGALAGLLEGFGRRKPALGAAVLCLAAMAYQALTGLPLGPNF